MRTRSIIDLITEGLQAKQQFANNLEQLCEKYNITDNIFCCDAGGELQEPDHGYFGQVSEHQSLKEAFKDFNAYTQGIRVKDNKFYVGNLYEKLADVKEEIIIDIKNSVVL